MTPADAARATRDLTARGILTQHRDGRIAMHDAFRLAVLSAEHDTSLVIRCRHVLKEILLSSLRQGVDAERLLAFLRILPLLGEMAQFVDFVSKHCEQIHEFGLMQAIEPFLHSAANDVTLAPIDRFWALDMLAFTSQDNARSTMLAAMSKIIVSDGALLGRTERISFLNKSILVRAEAGDLGEAREAFAAAMKLTETQLEKLLTRYTLASACVMHERWREAERSAQDLVKDYYDLFGLDESDVDFQQPASIIAKFASKIDDVTILKRVGDCHALAALARDRLGEHPRFARIHAMKFYAMAQAPVSAVRQGLDAASDFLRFGSDLDNAFMILDNHVERLVGEFRLVEFLVPLASMRAVLLAYSGKSDEAGALIEKFVPLAEGMTGPERDNFDQQRTLVAELAANPRRWLRH